METTWNSRSTWVDNRHQALTLYYVGYVSRTKHLHLVPQVDWHQSMVWHACSTLFLYFSQWLSFFSRKKNDSDEGRGGKMLCTITRKYFLNFSNFLSWSNWFVDVDPSGLMEGSVVSLFPCGRNGQRGREAISHFWFKFSFRQPTEGTHFRIHGWPSVVPGWVGNRSLILRSP